MTKHTEQKARITSLAQRYTEIRMKKLLKEQSTEQEIDQKYDEPLQQCWIALYEEYIYWNPRVVQSRENISALKNALDEYSGKGCFVTYFARYKGKNLEKEKLNTLAKEWYAAKESKNEKQIKELHDSLFVQYINYFDDCNQNEEYVLRTFDKGIEKYDPKVGDFAPFLKKMLDYRRFDQYRKNNSYVSGNERVYPKQDSLDQVLSEEDGRTQGDLIAAKSELSPEAQVIEKEQMRIYLAELAAMVLNFSERHHKKQATESKRKWYRLCYTEDVTIVLKDRLAPVTLFHERDAWTAMNHSYLDYYMAEPCNSLRAVVHTKFKPYVSLVPDDPQPKESLYRTTEGGENVFWAKIPLSYLKTLPESEGGGTFAESTRSTQRSSYKQELHKWTQKYK